MKSSSRPATVDTYRVGHLLNVHTYGLIRGTRRTLSYITYQARRRNWRAIRNTFNGYLAEPTPIPEGLTRCGTGWTAERARRDLERRMRALR